jgi:hypothetical protein
MSNQIFTSILEEKIEFFRFAFEQTSKNVFFDENNNKLIHPGEYGSYREAVTKDFFKMIIPSRLDIGSGFLISDIGSVSKQCDMIIYDKTSTPLIENNERQRFFPVETVCAIGEVKSDLSKADFIEAINKLARNKKIKEEMTNPSPLKRTNTGKFSPAEYPYDNIFSILICNKFQFDHSEIVDKIDSYYDSDIEQWQKHNLILSVNDGLLCYYDENDKSLMYPFIANKLKNRLIVPDSNKNCHFYFASSYIFMGTTSSSIYYPELSDYINLVGGKTFS